MTVLRNGAPRNRFLEEAQNSLKVIAGGRTTARINSAKVNFCFILFSLSFFSFASRNRCMAGRLGVSKVV